MEEVELLRALGDVWTDATEIIESMHALRKKIEQLLEAAQGDEELTEIYELVHAQIESVMASLRISQARIESSVMESVTAAATEGGGEEEEGEEEEEEEEEGDEEAAETEEAESEEPAPQAAEAAPDETTAA
jgi:spore cortex formation protein SpoVR/YcgB (stage V sporulation)